MSNQSVHFAAHLQELTSALLAALTPMEVAGIIANEVLSALDATVGVLFRLTDDGLHYQALSLLGFTDDIQQTWAEFPASAPVPIADAVRARQPIFLQSQEERLLRYPQYTKDLSPDRNGALAAIPLLVGDRIVGGLGVILPNLRRFEAADRTFLLTAGNQCALALERARLFAESQSESEERKRVEQALRESEAKYRRLAESGVIGVNMWQMDGRLTWVNDRFLEMTGYNRADADADKLRWDTMTPPEWQAATTESVRQIQQSGSFQPYEKEFYRQDGSRVPVLIGGALLEDGSGGISFILDLTRQKEAEYDRLLATQERRDADEMLRALIEASPLPIIHLDRNGHVRMWSPAATRLYGWTEEEVLGKPTPIVPEDRWPELVEQICATEEGRQILGLETVRRHKDGHLLDVSLWTSAVHDRDDKMIGVVIVAADISRRKQAELALRESNQRLRLALESGKLGTWHSDLIEQRFLEVSDTCKVHFGLAIDTKITSDNLIQYIHIDDQQSVREAARNALVNHEDFEAEFRVIWPDKSIHWLISRGTPEYNEWGQPVSMIGVTQDITERKAILQKAQERADRDPLTGLFNHRVFHKRLEEETSRAKRDGSTLAVVMMDLDNFKFFNDAYGHAIGDTVLRQVASRLHEICRDYDTIARFGGDEFAMLLPGVSPTRASEIETRLRLALDGLDIHLDGHETPVPIRVSLGVALLPDANGDRHEVVRLADERLRRSKTGGLVEMEAQRVRASIIDQIEGFSMLDSLVAAVDNKDRYTRRHSEDVMLYSLMIAREMNLSEEDQNTISIAALLHDIGKIGVPDTILRKPGKLTPEEFNVIKKHPEMGAIMVRAVAGLEGTLDAVRCHHERWDGSGYPNGLKGQDCPLIARIMSVADAFSAMTTDRPYRQGMDETQATEILSAGAGAQWDETVVQAFVSAYHKRSLN